jgi:hypothetical protein
LSPIGWLEENGAQRDVLDGLRKVSRTWESLWRECPRGDWLLGIAARLGVDRVLLVRAALGCARTALDHANGDEARLVIETVERWTRDEATADDVARATGELEAANARAVDPASEAAGRAAIATGLGVSEPEMLVAAASSAVEAHMMATIDCGVDMAQGWAHSKCADAVRAAIPWEAFSARLP